MVGPVLIRPGVVGWHPPYDWYGQKRVLEPLGAMRPIAGIRTALAAIVSGVSA